MCFPRVHLTGALCVCVHMYVGMCVCLCCTWTQTNWNTTSLPSLALLVEPGDPQPHPANALKSTSNSPQSQVLPYYDRRWM